LTKKSAGIVRFSCYVFEPNHSINSKWAIFLFSERYADLSMFMEDKNKPTKCTN